MPRQALTFPPLAMLLVGLAGAGPVAATGPTVGELLSVCERASAKGATGVDAAACEWYAAPCASKVRDPNSGALPWCVPDFEPIDVIVRKVLTALRGSARRDAPVEPEVERALERLYPCTGSPAP